MMLTRIDDWMPSPPRAVVEADEAITAAMERHDEIEDATVEEMQAIVARRREIAQPWPGKDRDAFFQQRTHGARRRVAQAEANLGRVAIEHADEWAPAIEEELEAVADAALKHADELLESLNRLARLRTLLDDVQDTPEGLRYFLPRVRNGLRLRTTIAAEHHGVVHDWVRDLIEGATPEGRRRLEELLNPPPRTQVVPAAPRADERVPVEQITGAW